MSASAQAQTTFAQRAQTASRSGALFAILAAAFVLRLVFLSGSGFHNDLAAFEAWALTLTEHPLYDFYRSTSFADYPPGYFFVLLGIGWLYKGLVALHVIAPDAYNVLGMLVKLPAIAMDIVNAWLIYRIAGRFASRGAALGAAMLYAFNPAAIYLSGYWGQVDSVSWGLVLAGLNLLLSARNDERFGARKITCGWFALAASILMKPQGTFVGLVFLAFAFVAPAVAERRRRVVGTLYGLAASLGLAWFAAALFHGSINPVDDAVWLYGRYAYGSGVYAYNTINAFNLYAVKQPFWQSDSQALILPLSGISLGPVVVWGWLLVVCSALLVAGRYLQRKDDRALLEAAMLVSFGFFIFATRMHERYIFGAFLLMMPLAALGRRYVWAAVAVSLTLFVNLTYSLAYQTVMEAKTPGVDATSLWPLVTGPLSALNVAVFFGLGYFYLGGTAGRALGGASESLGRAWTSGALATYLRLRNWFDPAEGVASMSRRDWLIAGAMTAGSFVLCILWYQWPAERYFDEVYYPRSAVEYLKHAGTAGDLGVFEWTHPPLTKLIITLSMLLFGGLHGLGNTGFGWRFLNIVIGALTVGVLYAFAKHLTRSTLFASIAAGMLLFDGFHYVQSRIATPEITVAFFSLTTLYAFYRLWIASQAQRRRVAIAAYRPAFFATLAAGTVLAAILAYVATNVGKSTAGPEFHNTTLLVAFVYFETAVYLFARVGLRRLLPANGADVSYADGTRIRVNADRSFSGITPEGEPLDPSAAKRGSVLATVGDGDLHRTYARDGELTYATPAAAATYRVDGSFSVAGIRLDPGDARFWMIALAISGGCLAASKWNGLFDFFVVWLLTGAVVAQRWLARPAVLGNPFGIALDVAVAAMVVVGGAIYIAAYIPHFMMGHNLVDVVSLQHEMYWYHSTLTATHPYASKWWQWPILQKPISYFYTDVRAADARSDATACCVAEILALPNPLVWWAGLLSIPAVAVLAVIERNKGYALLIAAYVFQWLPWIGSPRIAFEYHFYPNLSMIVLANAVILQRVWAWRTSSERFGIARIGVGMYLAAVVLLFFYFYPVLAGVHVSWNAWHDRMWLKSWII